jgi:hypothetical protein
MPSPFEADDGRDHYIGHGLLRGCRHSDVPDAAGERLGSHKAIWFTAESPVSADNQLPHVAKSLSQDWQQFGRSGACEGRSPMSLWRSALRHCMTSARSMLADTTYGALFP